MPGNHIQHQETSSPSMREGGTRGDHRMAALCGPWATPTVGPHTPGWGPASGWGCRGGLAFQHVPERGLRCYGQAPLWCHRARPGRRPCWGKPQCRRWLKFCILFASASRGSAAFFFFFFLPSRRSKKKKLRAAICRPWDVFLLDSLEPRLAGPSSTPRPQLWVCCRGPMHTEPAVREGGRDGGRMAGRQQPGLALPCFVPASLSRHSPPAGPPGPPCTHRGALTFWARPPGWGAAHAQGARPRPRHSHCSPRPAASAAASLAPCQAAWEPSPGGVGGGEGCAGASRGRGPDAQPARGASPCLPSPESHKGTDNTGGLVKTVMCRSRHTNKSPYLFI